MADVEHALNQVLAGAPDERRMLKLPRRAILALLGSIALGGLALETAGRLRGRRQVPRGPQPPPAVAPFGPNQAKLHQEAWADFLDLPLRFVNAAGMEMFLVPPGEYWMGLSEDHVPGPPPDEGNWRYLDPEAVRSQQLPRHRVVLSKPLYFGATEVTNEQFRLFVDATGYVTDVERSRGWGKEDRGWLKRAGYSWKNLGQRLCEDGYPVINVTWNDAVALCAWLSSYDQHGKQRPPGVYRLPTEAEWEFACRAGSTTAYFFGNDAAQLVDHAWFAENSEGLFRPVGTKSPNPFGIFDMYGNRQEWCLDNYMADFYQSAPLIDPVCETGGDVRVMRGGAHTDEAPFCTSARRWGQEADNPGAAGIRVVCELAIG